jgi:hypothetical protein
VFTLGCGGSIQAAPDGGDGSASSSGSVSNGVNASSGESSGTSESDDAGESGAGSGRIWGSSSGSGGTDGGNGNAAPLDCGTLVSTDVATFDSGSALWTCIQAVCAMTLGPCAASACCANGIKAALDCSADAAPINATAVSTCFVRHLNPVSTDPAVSALAPCLVSNQAACMGGSDGGGKDARASDASTGP